MGLENYQINRQKIGKGSFSKVYKGIQLKTNLSVALKIINKKKLDSDKKKECINNEILFLPSLKHKNIITFIESFEDENFIYIITEYYPYSLDNLIKSNANYNTKQIMIGVKEGLKYIIGKQIFHRDLKPENILLDHNFEVKIADFGMAKNFENENSLFNTICGTPYFMSKEILSGSDYNIKSDLWSVGILLYYLLFKKFPFNQVQNHIQLLQKINNLQINIPDTTDIITKDLLSSLLCVDLEKRITWEQFFNHTWFSENTKKIEDQNIILKNNKNSDLKTEDTIPDEIVKNINISEKITKIGTSIIIDNYMPVNIEKSGLRKCNTITTSKYSDSELYGSGVGSYFKSFFWT